MALKEISTEALAKELKRRKEVEEEAERKKREKRYVINYTNCNNARGAGSLETNDLEEAKQLAMNPNGYFEAEIYDREIGRDILISRPQITCVLYEIKEGPCPGCGLTEDQKEDKDGNTYEYHTVPCTTCKPERTDKETKLCAVAYGMDGLTGDSGFGVSSGIEATEDDTFEQLLERYGEDGYAAEIAREDYGGDVEEYYRDSPNSKPIGFWILEKSTVEVISAMYEADFGNDGAVYACNRAAKTAANSRAIKRTSATRNEIVRRLAERGMPPEEIEQELEGLLGTD